MRFKFNSIKDSVNVITGCGSGLGRATLQWLLKHKSGPILGIDRRFEPDYLDSLKLQEEQRNKLTLRTHDTFDEKVEGSLEEFVSKHGTIDNLVNVAGVAMSFSFYWKNTGTSYSMEHVHNLLNFNTVGTFNMIRLVSKYMIDSAKNQQERRTRCIINTSCISTHAPSLGHSFHAASNAAIDSMTLCIARELSPFSIRCNTINVGYFDTKLLRGSEDKVLDFIANAVCVLPKRIGQPEEFAHFVGSIIENEMLNGCCVKLDGAAKEVL